MAATKHIHDAGSVEEEAYGQGLDKLRRQLVAELTPALASLDRLVTLLRVYPLGHPLVEGFATSAAARLSKLAERFGPLEIEVSAEALTSAWGELLLDAKRSERGHFLWFQAASEGLAGFTLSAGLDGDELERFIHVIQRCDLGQLPADDDVITMCWDAALVHVEVHASPAPISGGVLMGQLSASQLAGALVAGALTPGDGAASAQLGGLLRTRMAPLDPATQARVTQAIQAPTMGGAPLKAAQMAEALRVDPRWLERVQAEWRQIEDLEYRLVESLLGIVRAQPASPAAQRALDTIGALIGQLFDARRWEALRALVRLLRARQAQLTPQLKGAADPIGALLARTSEPMRLEALLHQLQRARADQTGRAGLMELLLTLDADAVQRQLLRALADAQRELPSPAALVELLLRVTTLQTASALRSSELLENPHFLLNMVAGLAGRELGQHAASLSALYCAALDHDLIELRRAALAAYSPQWGSRAILERYVEPLAHDRDEEVRRLALELLRREHPQRFLDLLDQLVERGQLIHRSAGEVRFLIRQYMELRPGGERRLRALLDTRGWFDSERREVARAVAGALIDHGDAETLEMISAQARSLWTYPKLRYEYRLLIERLQQRGVVQPPPDEPEEP